LIGPARQSRKVNAMDRIGERLRRLIDDDTTEVPDQLTELMERLEAQLASGQWPFVVK
jgi:hypothetical protein